MNIMSYKRKQREQDAVLGVTNREAAEADLIKRFGLDTAQLQDNSPGLSYVIPPWESDFHIEVGTGVSFSKVTFETVAPLVGLDPSQRLGDIKTFEIHRSRIPTDLFKSIVMDMDVMLMQYGPLPDHDTEEARSRFFSPVKTLEFSWTPELTLVCRFSIILWNSSASC
jgi:hypothetical protein